MIEIIQKMPEALTFEQGVHVFFKLILVVILRMIRLLKCKVAFTGKGIDMSCHAFEKHVFIWCCFVLLF